MCDATGCGAHHGRRVVVAVRDPQLLPVRGEDHLIGRATNGPRRHNCERSDIDDGNGARGPVVHVDLRRVAVVFQAMRSSSRANEAGDLHRDAVDDRNTAEALVGDQEVAPVWRQPDVAWQAANPY